MNIDFFSKTPGGSQNPFFHTLSDYLSDAVILINEQLLIEHWNTAAGRLYGFTPTEAIGKNILHLLQPMSAEGGFEKIVQQVREDARWEGGLAFINKGKEKVLTEICPFCCGCG